MGLMYWQINDIWQAPTWSTIEYGLRWKMAHYYARHMYAFVYPMVVLTPYLADLTDESARLSFYVINELLTDSVGQLACSVHTLDTFSVRASWAFDVAFDSSTQQHVTDLPYASFMARIGCSHDVQCLVHCSYSDAQQAIDQTLFLTQPKNYRLVEPNIRISHVQSFSPTDVSITIIAARPALFVWLEQSSPDTSGYFSHNGFHMFVSTMAVTFHSWSPMADSQRAQFNLTVSSLFDVTQA